MSRKYLKINQGIFIDIFHLDTVVDNEEDFMKQGDIAEKWKERLSEVFNRGFWDGYYLGQRLGEWNNMHGSKAKYHKEFVGTVNNFFSRLSVAEIYINSGKISVGERVLIIGPTTGTIDMTISEIRFDDRKSDTAVKGDVISIPVPEKVRRSDKLYVLVED